MVTAASPLVAPAGLAQHADRLAVDSVAAAVDGLAGVDHERVAGDHPRAVAGEVDGGVGDVVGQAGLVQQGDGGDGASDHGVSEALYLPDPDENGIELYWDRPREEWPKTASGALNMFTHPLDLNGLLAEAK